LQGCVERSIDRTHAALSKLLIEFEVSEDLIGHRVDGCQFNFAIAGRTLQTCQANGGFIRILEGFSGDSPKAKGALATALCLDGVFVTADAVVDMVFGDRQVDFGICVGRAFLHSLGSIGTLLYTG
jgi:uncharacterized YccA/Bax inhibitor family protein